MVKTLEQTKTLEQVFTRKGNAYVVVVRNNLPFSLKRGLRSIIKSHNKKHVESIYDPKNRKLATVIFEEAKDHTTTISIFLTKNTKIEDVFVLD